MSGHEQIRSGRLPVEDEDHTQCILGFTKRGTSVHAKMRLWWGLLHAYEAMKKSSTPERPC